MTPKRRGNYGAGLEKAKEAEDLKHRGKMAFVRSRDSWPNRREGRAQLKMKESR